MSADHPNVLTFDVVSKLLRYEPETGKLFWRTRDLSFFKAGKQPAEHSFRKWNTRYAETEAFTSKDRDGYLIGDIFNKTYRSHRVVWLLATGEWPCDQLDHINGVKTDNRLANLREVDNLTNGKNQRLSLRNTSGAVGVRWSKRHEKWIANIKASGRNIYIGLFEDFEEAVAARKSAEAYYGFHKNHGSVLS